MQKRDPTPPPTLAAGPNNTGTDALLFCILNT